jgi:hypothetical protein
LKIILEENPEYIVGTIIENMPDLDVPDLDIPDLDIFAPEKVLTKEEILKIAGISLEDSGIKRKSSRSKKRKRLRSKKRKSSRSKYISRK